MLCQPVSATDSAPAKACLNHLSALAEATQTLGIPLPIPGYFLNPGGFIASAAAAHNRIDLARDAIIQVETLQKTLKTLSIPE